MMAWQCCWPLLLVLVGDSLLFLFVILLFQVGVKSNLKITPVARSDAAGLQVIITQYLYVRSARALAHTLTSALNLLSGVSLRLHAY